MAKKKKKRSIRLTNVATGSNVNQANVLAASKGRGGVRVSVRQNTGGSINVVKVQTAAQKKRDRDRKKLHDQRMKKIRDSKRSISRDELLRLKKKIRDLLGRIERLLV